MIDADSKGAKLPKTLKSLVNLTDLGTNLTKRRIHTLRGAKPPKIFEILTRFASRDESDNRRNRRLLASLGAKPPTIHNL